MKHSVPKCLKKLSEKLPVPLFIVGGATRNYLAGLYQTDIDICAAITADDFCAAGQSLGFTINAIYHTTQTVNITYGDYSFEFSALRSETYKRGHTPDTVTLTSDLKVDALRRDFTCNAIYYDIENDKFIDTTGGIEDIKNKVLRTVRKADEVFANDGLRIMRLARLAGELGFSVEAQTLLAAQKNTLNLKDIKPERIFTELNKILQADTKNNIKYGQYHALKVLAHSGALKEILPELAEGKGIVQRKDFHKYDVLEHSLRAVMYADPQVRLAALLHDIGKPYCYNLYGNFKGHERVGAQIATAALQRLKAPKKTVRVVRELVLKHMYDFDLNTKSAKIKRFIIENYEIYRPLLKLKQADFSAASDSLNEAPVIIKWEKVRTEMINQSVPLILSDLEIDGKDVERAGFTGKQIKEVLQHLFWQCVESPAKNQREYLLARLEALNDPDADNSTDSN